MYVPALSVLLVTVCSATLMNLRTEWATNPITIDNPAPRFSWEASVAQTSYNIVVMSESGVAWVSGNVSSSATSGIVYAGAKLTSDTDYKWTVSSADSAGNWSSSSAYFGTALFSAADWKGQWIAGSNALATAFSLAAPVIVRARAFVTAVGCYELWLNGEKVSQGGLNASDPPSFINPGISTIYSMRLLYNVYDITMSIRPGSNNEVGLRLGSCKYGYLGEFCPGGNSSACNRALLQLSILDVTGNRSLITSGGDWVTSVSPVRSDHFYNGETYDARVALHGTWIASGAGPATVVPSPTAVLSSHTMPQVFAYETRPAIRVSALPHVTGAYVFDLGLNGAGVCQLTMPGPLLPGSYVNITYAELLNPNGTGAVFVQFACPDTHAKDGGNCASQFYSYITRGGQDNESYAQSFSYSGARYAQVVGWPSAEPPTPDLLSCAVTSTGSAVAGSVEFNGTAYAPILNAIQAAIVRSQRSNLQSMPTDCPTREKRGWMADAHVTAPEASLNLFMAPVYENWLRTHADTLEIGCGGDPLQYCDCYKKDSTQPGNCPTPPPSTAASVAAHPLAALLKSTGAVESPVPNCYFCCSSWDGFGCTPETPPQNSSRGAIPDVIPFDKNGYGSFPGSICWTSAFFVVADVLLERYNDIQALEALYPSLAQHFAFYASNAAKNGGLVQWENYGDWNGLVPSSPLMMANAYFTYDAIIMAKIALALGRTSDAIAYLITSASTKVALGRAFFSVSEQYWDTGSQSAQALALAFDLGEGELANFTGAVAAHLVADVLSQGTHLTTGTLGARWLLQALSTSGRGDVALALAAQTSSPSWGYMVMSDYALGTLWESWDKPLGQGGSSMNHAFMGGGIGEWFYEFALGLRYRHRRTLHQTGGVRCDLPRGISAALVDHELRLTNDEVCALALTFNQQGSAKGQSLARITSTAKQALRELATRREQSRFSLPDLTGLVPEASLILDDALVPKLRFAGGHLDTIYGRLAASWNWSTSTAPSESTGEVQTTLSAELSVPGSIQMAVFVQSRLLERFGLNSNAQLTISLSGQPRPAVTGPHALAVPVSLLLGLRAEAPLREYIHLDGPGITTRWVNSALVFELQSASVLDAAAEWLCIQLPREGHGHWSLTVA